MNPDQQLVNRFCRDSRYPLLVDTNPYSIALRTTLERVDVARGVLEVTFFPGAEFVQGAGVIQGGVVASMLDFAMGFVVMVGLPDGFTMATAQLSVSFLRGARSGICTVVATIEKRGKAVAFANARIVDATGALVATATAVGSIFAEAKSAGAAGQVAIAVEGSAR